MRALNDGNERDLVSCQCEVNICFDNTTEEILP